MKARSPATRLLRGEEDAGRWRLVLAGDTRPSRATAATLAALGAAAGVIFAGTAFLTACAGRNRDVDFSVADACFYALSVAIAPAVFVAVGALASQLSRTRRAATGLALGIFAFAFTTTEVRTTSRAAGPN